jgi:glycosyltransferase involved in cell wall biosynthesis
VEFPATLALSAQSKYKRSDLFYVYERFRKSHNIEVISPIFSNQWIKLWKIFVSPKGFIWLFLRLPFKLLRGKYSLFVAHCRDPQAIITIIISKLLRKPTIISDSGYMWIKGDIRGSLLWPFSRFVCFQSTYLNVSSFRVRNFWVSAGIPAEKIRVNYTFTSVLKPNRKTSAKALEIEKKLGYKKIVLFVGRLIKEKGIDYLIRAFAKFSGFKDLGLLIVGDGPERNRLQKLCEESNLSNVVFIWHPNERTEIEPYFVLCDILVLPSITLKEPEEWGLVVNEAMSVGKPVVVSSSVGCAYELVKNAVNGYIVQEKNVDALFLAMEKLIINDELRLQMGNEAKKTIANQFTYLHSIDSLSRLHQEAMKKLVS